MGKKQQHITLCVLSPHIHTTIDPQAMVVT
jgi:hypothetical protein